MVSAKIDDKVSFRDLSASVERPDAPALFRNNELVGAGQERQINRMIEADFGKNAFDVVGRGRVGGASEPVGRPGGPRSREKPGRQIQKRQKARQHHRQMTLPTAPQVVGPPPGFERTAVRATLASALHELLRART
jgi:hypothetical protein